MRRRTLSLILVLSMLLSITVFATETAATPVHTVSEEVTTIDVADFAASNHKVNSSGYMDMYTNHYATYDLDVLVSGVYEVSILNRLYSWDNPNGAPISLSLDTVEQSQTTIFADSTNQKTDVIGSVTMKKGSHSIKILHLGTRTHLFQVVLTRTEELPEEIECNGADYTSCSHTQSPSTGMGSDAWATYDVAIEKGGTYGVVATVAANIGATPTLNCTLGEQLIGATKFTGTGWHSGESANYKIDIFLGYATLAEGTHSIKFTAQNNGLRLLSFRLKEVDAADEQAFLSAMQSAQTAEDIETALAAYEGKLLISYAELLEPVFYKRVVFEQMLLAEYNTLAEVEAQLAKLVEKELANPIVRVEQNGEGVAQIAPGELSVTIGPRFAEPITAVAALYNEAETYLYDVAALEVVPFEPQTITGLTATAESPKLKVFFLDDFGLMRPAELPLLQNTIFVATDGNDANRGTWDAPLATLAGAAEKVAALNEECPRDITVNFESGTYFVPETVLMDESHGGQAGYSVTYRSLDSANPALISGGVAVTGWTDENEDGIYEATVPEGVTDVRQFYVNGYPAQRARSSYMYRGAAHWDNPETEVYEYKVWENNQVVTYTAYDRDGFVVTDPTFPVLEKPEDAETVHVINWASQRLPIDNIVYDENGATVKMNPQPYAEAITMICDGGVQPVLGHPFYLENDLALLNEAGEFYYNKETSRIYYKPFAEEDLTKAETIVASTEKLLDIRGSSLESRAESISFENIDFRYGAYYTEINDYGAVAFQAECLVSKGDTLTSNINKSPTGRYGRLLPAQIEVTNASEIVFSGCDISCMGSSALRLSDGVIDSAVTGCTLRDNGGSAISVGNFKTILLGGSDDTAETIAAAQANLAANIAITNNVITRAGNDLMSSTGVAVYYANNVDILHNHVLDVPYSGISVGWGWNSASTFGDETPEKLLCYSHNIDYNRVDYTSHTLWDGGQIYVLGYLKPDSTVNNNYLSRGYGGFGGIYFDTGSNVGEIQNNVIDDTENWMFGGGSVIDAELKGNYSETASIKQYGLTDSNAADDVIICPNREWPAEALAIIENAGAAEAYKALLDDVALPEWRPNFHTVLPTEYLAPGAICRAAGDYDDFAVHPDPSVNGGKTKPGTLIRNGYKSILDYRQGELLIYNVDVPAAGEYTFTLDYNAGGNTMVWVYANPAEPLVYGITNWPKPPHIELPLPAAKLPSGAFVSITAEQTLTLNKGVNTIYMGNRSYSPNVRSFTLTPCP